MYCPCCKEYDERDTDPLENIQKFMDYIQEEQDKLLKRKTKAQKNREKTKHRRGQSQKLLPDDSASDITYLEEEEILAKYYDETMTKEERKAKERKVTQARLYGITKHKCTRKNCFACNRPKTPEPPKKPVKMELREVEDPISMHDESNSAHQFSLIDQSVQADSEARLDLNIQTSAVDMLSAGAQYSNQNAHSIMQ